jgi:hypothetical protein
MKVRRHHNNKGLRVVKSNYLRRQVKRLERQLIKGEQNATNRGPTTRN